MESSDYNHLEVNFKIHNPTALFSPMRNNKMKYYKSSAYTLDELEERLRSFVPNPQLPHDPFAVVAIEEAIIAAREGNFGVGACLVKDSVVVERGHNHQFQPYFRSDLHAEMDLMTRFEDRVKVHENMRQYSLFSSLEPCPMCTLRLINSGVGKIFSIAPDEESGMARTVERLGPVWAGLAKRQEFAMADCSPELQDLALQVWLVPANKLTDALY
jgi:tRNA(adenine34) deaminase